MVKQYDSRDQNAVINVSFFESLTKRFLTERFLTERFLTKSFLRKRFLTNCVLTECFLPPNVSCYKTCPTTKRFLLQNVLCHIKFPATKRKTFPAIKRNMYRALKLESLFYESRDQTLISLIKLISVHIGLQDQTFKIYNIHKKFVSLHSLINK